MMTNTVVVISGITLQCVAPQRNPPRNCIYNKVK